MSIPKDSKFSLFLKLYAFWEVFHKPEQANMGTFTIFDYSEYRQI